jgi:hypothetical protein
MDSLSPRKKFPRRVAEMQFSARKSEAYVERTLLSAAFDLSKRRDRKKQKRSQKTEEIAKNKGIEN